jgi:hypothetical protein
VEWIYSVSTVHVAFELWRACGELLHCSLGRRAPAQTQMH